MDTTITQGTPFAPIASREPEVRIAEFTNTNKRQRKALGWCIAITITAMIAEFVASAITGSLMLYSDALHMFSHAASLGISLLAAELAARKVGERFPFGLRKVETLAAFVNGLGLVGFTFYIVLVSVDRLIDPTVISSRETIAVAILGLVVNLLTALILSRAGLENLNTRSAFLHMLADTFSSVAIVAGGIVILYTDWYALDAILSLVVAAVVGKWAFGLLRDSSLLLLDATPTDVNRAKIEHDLIQQVDGITAVKSLKVWETGTEYRVANVKLVTESIQSPEEIQAANKAVERLLSNEHSISEANIQLMPSANS